MNEYFTPIYTAIVSALVGYLFAKIRTLKKESKAERQALGALLRNDMFRIYEKYRDAKEVPASTQEEIDSLYRAYHGLGFNNVGTKIHDEIMAKPTEVTG